MDFQLTEEQRQVRDLCREFAEKELLPNARQLGRRAPVPRARR